MDLKVKTIGILQTRVSAGAEDTFDMLKGLLSRQVDDFSRSNFCPSFMLVDV